MLMVQVPAQVFGVAGKYASALYVSAFKTKKLESVEKEMKELAEVRSCPLLASIAHLVSCDLLADRHIMTATLTD